MIKLLTVIAALLAALAIWTDYKGPRKLFYLFKPLTTVTIIAIAVLSMMDSGRLTFAPYLIIAGLVCCLVGDIFIMLGERTFIYGIVSFALGHILFSLFLVVITGFKFTWWLFLIFLLIGLSVARNLLPDTGKLKGAVVVYMTLIVLMIWLSSERLFYFRDFASIAMILGTLLFGVSDITLAIDKFKDKFKAAEFIILGTYFPAIWCIAYSLFLASV